jgi:hypothetical protein
VPGVTDLNIQLSKKSNTQKAAVCIPSDPMDVHALRGPGSDLLVRRWWAEWRHNIALNFGDVRHIGPLFLVLQKTDTEQFANCYYTGRDSETSLKISGTVANVSQVSLRSGFSCLERGLFGFKTSSHIPGKKWAIFIQSEKLYLIWFTKFKSIAARLWQFLPSEYP